MDHIIALRARECKELLKIYCGLRGPATRKRTEIVLLPVDGPAWATGATQSPSDHLP
ncbi:MAG: hypothetical protein JSU86_12245 [Phycisphaerales bacterium]|nr:MAG: hypothetical protein JSU86_12245 [Phycisphaerales bacterium]